MAVLFRVDQGESIVVLVVLVDVAVSLSKSSDWLCSNSFLTVTAR